METPKQYYLSGLVQRAFRHNVIIVIVIIGRLDEGFLTSHVDFKKANFACLRCYVFAMSHIEFKKWLKLVPNQCLFWPQCHCC